MAGSPARRRFALTAASTGAQQRLLPSLQKVTLVFLSVLAASRADCCVFAARPSGLRVALSRSVRLETCCLVRVLLSAWPLLSVLYLMSSSRQGVRCCDEGIESSTETESDAQVHSALMCGVPFQLCCCCLCSLRLRGGGCSPTYMCALMFCCDEKNVSARCCHARLIICF